jgi:hypothetical protein
MIGREAASGAPSAIGSGKISEVIETARYRSKDEVDLAWNDTRRRITNELDLQIKTWRERTLNELLSTAWEEFKKGLQTGEVLELEPSYTQFVQEALDRSIEVTVEREAA